MNAFTTAASIAIPLYRPNIDTDTIIPSREIKSVGRAGLGEGAFAFWRYLPPDSSGQRVLNPDFVLNRSPYQGASILVAGENFGCGSSREAAVWALEQLGIRCIIAPSFGAIFRANCVANGLLPVQLPVDVVRDLAARAERGDLRLTVDLQRCTVTAPGVDGWSFAVEAGVRERLLEGLDEIGMTLKRADQIAYFQNEDRSSRPWIWLAAA